MTPERREQIREIWSGGKPNLGSRHIFECLDEIQRLGAEAKELRECLDRAHKVFGHEMDERAKENAARPHSQPSSEAVLKSFKRGVVFGAGAQQLAGERAFNAWAEASELLHETFADNRRLEKELAAALKELTNGK